MTKIKSAKAYNHIYERYYGEIDEIHDLDFYDGAVEMSMPELLQILDRYRDTAITAVKIAETEAEERHAKELQELKDKAVDRANVTMGAMILDGYDPEDACVKYMQELIEELKN